MFLPWSKLSRLPRLANFENFRKQITQLYTYINRLLSGQTYVDLFSAQTINTPVTTNGGIYVNPLSALTSDNQIPNWPSDATITSITTGANSFLTISSGHTFVPGMYVNYLLSTTGSAAITGLLNNRSYYVNSVSGNNLQISKQANGQNVQLSGTKDTGTHTIQYSQAIPELDDRTLLKLDSNIPSETSGSIAYASINTGSPSTYLYWYDGAQYDYVKLGWPGGNGIYNNNATVAQANTGWCHGTGNYKIIATTDEIKIKFDFIEVVQYGSGARDYVPGVRTSPVTDYNVLITRTTAGLNSIDTGIFATSSGYWIYLLYNPATRLYAGVASLSYNYPAFSSALSGYTYYQRLGWISTDAAGQFIPSVQINDDFKFFGQSTRLATLSTTISTAEDSTVPTIQLMNNTISTSALYPFPVYLRDADFGVSVTDCSISRPIYFFAGSNTNRDYSFINIPLFCQNAAVSSGIGTFVAYHTPLYSNSSNTSSFSLSIIAKDTGSCTLSANVSLTGFRFNEELLI